MNDSIKKSTNQSINQSNNAESNDLSHESSHESNFESNLESKWLKAFSNEKKSIPIKIISADAKGLPSFKSLKLSEFQKNWIQTQNFQGNPGQFILVPEEKTGAIQKVIYVQSSDFWDFGRLAEQLPKGQYELIGGDENLNLDLVYLAWGLSHYKFDRFLNKKASDKKLPQATLKPLADPLSQKKLEDQLEAIYLVRDLVNTPAESLGPEELQAVMAKVSTENGAELKGVIGEELLTQNFPAIHAVGRAAGEGRAPRLLHLSWENKTKHKTKAKNPVICLVGKGVCFDTGGLDIKDPAGMLTMKKDMGGAAHALALGQWMMKANLPISLHVIVPAVENSIAGNSYRPGDVISTRKNLTVEIVNTDAEGRVILSDALAYAEELKPDLLIDFATLTGAARVALGPELPVIYASDRKLSRSLLESGEKVSDLMWELPLYQPYREYFKSDIADMTNSALTSHAGSITAALFLQSFVNKNTPWIHVDVMAWNTSSRSSRPKGGEAQSIRAFFDFIFNFIVDFIG
jgi:leucyl aminopeptidase